MAVGDMSASRADGRRKAREEKLIAGGPCTLPLELFQNTRWCHIGYRVLLRMAARMLTKAGAVDADG